MSQVVFKTKLKNKQVEVMAGWDHPLEEYFMTIFDLNPADEDQDIIWSSIDHYSPLDEFSTDRLRKVLADLGVDAPAKFWYTVELQEENITHRL